MRPKTTYKVSFYAKAAAGFTGPLTASLESTDGKTVFARAEISGLTGDWKKFETTLTTKNVKPSKEKFQTHDGFARHDLAAAGFAVPADFQKPPERRPRGHIATARGLQPKFLRFPGGNYLEGDNFNERFNWKKTIGPIERVPAIAAAGVTGPRTASACRNFSAGARTSTWNRCWRCSPVTR